MAFNLAGSMNLSPHFTLEEAMFSSTAARLDIDNTPPDSVRAAMVAAANGMEKVRQLFGTPIHVDSWYRCPVLNTAVGGSKTSAHMSGYAVDFICKPHSVEEIIQTIAGADIEFDQMIDEHGWCHISFAPRAKREILVAHFSPSGTTYSSII